MATATPDEERALLPRTATSDSPTTADYTATGPPTHSPPDSTAGQQLRLHEKFPITCGVVWNALLVILMIGLSVGIYFVVAWAETQQSAIRWVIIAPCFVLVILLIVYFVEMSRSSLLQSMNNERTTDAAINHIRVHCAARPRVTHHVHCWHEETTTRTETTQNADGTTSYRTVTETHQVTTARDHREFRFAEFEDRSQPPEVLQQMSSSSVSVHFRIQLAFLDDETKHACDDHLAQLYRDYRHRDHHVDTWRTVSSTANAWASHMLVTNSSSWFFSRTCYWLSGFVGLNWLYRIVASAAVFHADFVFVKSITLRSSGAAPLMMRHA